MADDDEWDAPDSARDKLDKLDNAAEHAEAVKKDLDAAKMEAAKLLATTKKPETARSYDSDSSGETIYSKYTHYDYKKEDSPTKPLEKYYRKLDKADPKGALYRKLLRKAGISRAHVENMPREGKLSEFKMGKLSTRLYDEISGERTHDKYYHWLPPKKLEDVVEEEVKELLEPKRLNMLSPKEQTLALIRKTPTKPMDVNLPKQRLIFEPDVVAPPGLHKAVKKHLHSRGNHVYFNYSGSWKNGKLNGRGTMCFVDGSTHNGVWKSNRRHGPGISKDKAGHVYDGMWANDKFHGKGTMTFKSGVKYTGDWANGKRHGKGVIRYPGGQVYDGGWAENKKHGWGTFTNSAGFKYNGSMKEGLIEGPGAFYTPDGKRKTKSFWERSSFSDLVQDVQNEQKREQEEYLKQFREKYADVDADNLEAYVEEVREYNEQAEREKYEMQLQQQRKEREERREKMRQAKLDASAAMQTDREGD